MPLLATLRRIYRHPLNADAPWRGLLRFATWQVRTRLRPGPLVHAYTERSKLLVSRGMSGATGNIYCGLIDYADMGFLLHFLRPGELFVDVGANVGTYSVLAAAEIGADTIAVEPVPAAFAHLTANVALNEVQERLTALNVAVGSEPGTLAFTATEDINNHVTDAAGENTIQVEVRTLDGILSGHHPTLLKVDVEGYEAEVFRGGEATLAQESLQAIIIELDGLGNRYGYDERKVHDRLVKAGFHPCSYDPRARALVVLPSFGRRNTIYVRDVSAAQRKLVAARSVVIDRGRLAL